MSLLVPTPAGGSFLDAATRSCHPVILVLRVEDVSLQRGHWFRFPVQPTSFCYFSPTSSWGGFWERRRPAVPPCGSVLNDRLTLKWAQCCHSLSLVGDETEYYTLMKQAAPRFLILANLKPEMKGVSLSDGNLQFRVDKSTFLASLYDKPGLRFLCSTDRCCWAHSPIGRAV